MERQFLISLLLLFSIFSCQTTSNLSLVSNTQCISTDSQNKCFDNTEELQIAIKPIPSDVWEYMIFNSEYDKNIILDQKTLSYINKHIRDIEKFGEVNFKKIGYPLLFLPFVSRASEVIGKRLFLKLDKKEFLLNFNNNIYSNFFKNDIVELAENVSIKFIDNSDLFSNTEWQELYKLSENTFVEESDSLKRSGAGAGLTDND